MYRISKKTGFTLAEVLITLGIIGVVAVLVIPLIYNNSEEVELRARAKKAYNIITSATNQLTFDNGGNIWTEITSNVVASRGMRDNYVNYLDVVESNDNPTLIFTPSYRDYNKSTVHFYATWPAVKLSDGQLIQFIDLSPSNCTGTMSQWKAGGSTTANVCGEIMIDTNGYSKPNMWGKDLISFWIVKKGQSFQVIPFGSGSDGFTCSSSSCDAWGQVCGMGCSNNLVTDKPLQ